MIPNAVVAGAIDLVSRVTTSAADAVVQQGKDAADNWMKNAKGRGIVELAQQARVEPIVQVDDACANMDSITDILQSTHAIFTGYYLQAVDALARVDGVSVGAALAPISPNPGMESFGGLGFGLSKKAREFKKKQIAAALEDDKTKPVSMNDVGQSAALSLGKFYNVTIVSNGQRVSIPVGIRLMVNIVPRRTMVDFFTYRDAFDMSMKERWHMYRGGELRLRDLILCNDLIEKKRRMALTDKTGVGAAMLERERNHAKRVLAGRISYSSATNIAIVSTETIGDVEGKLGGRFSNQKVRNAVFDNSQLMLLVVVDKFHERVTIYTRGIALPTVLSFNQLKSANKGGGSEVVDIMKAYMLGSSPQHL